MAVIVDAAMWTFAKRSTTVEEATQESRVFEAFRRLPHGDQKIHEAQKPTAAPKEVPLQAHTRKEAHQTIFMVESVSHRITAAFLSEPVDTVESAEAVKSLLEYSSNIHF